MSTSGPDHGHDHGHPHGSTHADARGHVSSHNPYAGQGPVVLDLGDGIGAAVLRTPEDMVGHEIHISPVGEDERRHHVEVLPRRTPGGSLLCAAVFPGLPEGDWTVWREDGKPALVVEVLAGRVSEVQWPSD